MVLTDVTGGTPFNSTGYLAKDHKIGLVSGMSMPMLITLIFARTEKSTLDELIQEAVSPGALAVKGMNLSEGSMENLVLTRIDDRLIHGQVMTAWIKQKNAVQVVVADDEVAEDEFMINVLEMAVPDEIAIGIFNRDDAVEFMKQGLEAPTILLVKGPEILNYMVDHGIEIDEIDVGGRVQKRGEVFCIKTFPPTRKKIKTSLI